MEPNYSSPVYFAKQDLIKVKQSPVNYVTRGWRKRLCFNVTLKAIQSTAV
jgi:hypothetical protein